MVTSQIKSFQWIMMLLAVGMLLTVALVWHYNRKYGMVLGAALLVLFLGYAIFGNNSVKDSRSNSIIEEIKTKLSKINPAFKNVPVFPNLEGNTYTENKETIYLAMNKPDGEGYCINTLTYALLHELAHVFNDTNGHTPEFNKLFESYVCAAVKMGLYDPDTQHDDIYCGVDMVKERMAISCPK